jgi:hypothetical protein
MGSAADDSRPDHQMHKQRSPCSGSVQVSMVDWGAKPATLPAGIMNYNVSDDEICGTYAVEHALS